MSIQKSKYLPMVDEKGFTEVQSKKRLRRSSSATSTQSPTHIVSDTRTTQAQIPPKEVFTKMNTEDKLNTLFEMFFDIGPLTRNVDSLTQNLYLTNAKADVSEARLRLLEYKSIDNEAKLLKGNLVFTGMEELHNDDCTTLVRNLISTKLNIKHETLSLYRAYRLGRRRFTRPGQTATGRPILAMFSNPNDADQVLAEARLLRGTTFGISRDYPKEIREARQELWPDYKAAKAKYGPRHVKLRYPAALEINGDTVRDLFPNWFSILRGSRNSNIQDRVYERLSKTLKDSVHNIVDNQGSNPKKTPQNSIPLDPSNTTHTDSESDGEPESEMSVEENMGPNGPSGDRQHGVNGPGYLLNVHPQLAKTLDLEKANDPPPSSQPPSQQPPPESVK